MNKTSSLYCTMYISDVLVFAGKVFNVWSVQSERFHCTLYNNNNIVIKIIVHVIIIIIIYVIIVYMYSI